MRNQRAASSEVIHQRRQLCGRCPDAFALGNECAVGPTAFCTACQGLLRLKTAIAAECCPRGHWQADVSITHARGRATRMDHDVLHA